MSFGCLERYGLARLAAETRAAVLPIVAVGATAIAAVGALAVDASRAYTVQNELQTAVDAAALAAGRDLRDPALALLAAQHIVQMHFPVETHGKVLDDADFVLGIWDTEKKSFTPDATQPNAVSLTVRRAEANGNPERMNFAGLVGFSTLDLEARATVVVTSNLPLCLLALNPTQKNALEAAGSSQVTAEDCVVYSNSSSVDSIHSRPSASITASAICAHGGAKGTGFSPAPETGCPRLADPLAGLPSPDRWPSTHCDDTNGSFGPGSVTLSPGVYCGGIEVKASTTVTLMPGVYQIVEGGGFMAGSGARVVGSGVHINVSGSGTIDLRGTPELELSAPTTGDYAGVVLHADRSQSGRTHYITGNSQMFVDGTFYAPTGSVEFTGNSRAAITMLVADIIKFNGNSTFQRRAQLTSVPIPSGFSGIGAAARVMLVR